MNTFSDSGNRDEKKDTNIDYLFPALKKRSLMLLSQQNYPLCALFSMVFQLNDREATVDAKNRLEVSFLCALELKRMPLRVSFSLKAPLTTLVFFPAGVDEDQSSRRNAA